MKYLGDFFQLFFPRQCCLCGELLANNEHDICSSCLIELPFVVSTDATDNPVEHRLRGRIPIDAATALLYFQQGNKTQRLLHQIKYSGNEKLAVTMGRRMGIKLAESGQFDNVDILVPVPLHRSKLRKRGYNQSLLLCKGIAQTFPRPISDSNLVRKIKTDSQTHKNREERMENMSHVFEVRNPEALSGKHLLLVDDVITTGATAEACCQALCQIPKIRLSLACLAMAGDC